MTTAHVHRFYGAIPALYSPPLSDDVIACAQRIAADMLARHGCDYSDAIPALYRNVRAAMNRANTAAPCPTLDDESISEGIVRALNAR